MSDIINQIKSAYEREEPHRGQPVFDAATLPTTYEAITGQWLTSALCGTVDGAEVVEHSLGPDDSGSSNRRKISVRYNEAGSAAGLPRLLFCKASHGLANRMTLGIAGAAESEVNFYNHIRPLLRLEAPRSFYAKVDLHSFNSLVVLADLSDSVTEFCTHSTRVTRQRAESQMALLAELHGKGYRNREIRSHLDKLRTWPDYFTHTLTFGMKEGSEQGFIVGEEVIPPRLFRRQLEIWPATLASLESHRRLEVTCAHGDVHLKNWYVAGNGEMGLSDWQCANRGHWGRDFAYTISTALTIEDRRAWERDLLGYYLDRLHAAGGPAVDFDEAWTHYRQQLMTALTWWTITLNPAPGMPDMQPRDTTLEFVRRIATAMDDVDSLDSF